MSVVKRRYGFDLAIGSHVELGMVNARTFGGESISALMAIFVYGTVLR